MNYHEAVRQMHQGNVVKYIGTSNGNIMTSRGCSWCMQRGIVFAYENGNVVSNSEGSMVYDPDFLYALTGETVDTNSWPYLVNKKRLTRD